MDLIVHADGIAEWNNQTFRCAIGKNGITEEKREGDWCTPAGRLQIRRVFFREDHVRLPSSPFPTSPLRNNDGWCDDPSKPEYNTHVSLPFDGSHESLWRDDELYDIIFVLGYNDLPPVPGKGSAIFLHVARPSYSPTAGCIAMNKNDLETFLAEATADSQVHVDV